jgi:serine/threonine-protein kinase RsbW
MTLTRRIACDARRDQLPALLQFVEDACTEAALPEDVAFAVKLATEEASTNVVLHGYRGLPPGPIAISIERDPGQVVVTIEDRGAPFHPEDVPAPALRASVEERPLGGLGWHLIKSVMDEVHHHHDDTTGNTLTLVKRIPFPALP